jgi:ABC transport system ATP-binding/permease protein
VPQDDIVHRDLPVESALRYAARLRLPPDMQAPEIDRRIDDVLTRLDMPDKKKDSIATLSGGQRKRVNIAVEMLADPDLFFLDEPSSGLDPGTEKKLMYDMHRVADSGKTVIMITHATDNIDQCDQVAFMGYGGNLVFYGPPREALTFFQAQNFADIYLKLNNPQEVQRWRQHYEQSPYYQQYVQSRIATAAQPAPPSAAQRPSTHLGVGGGARQYGILTHRYLELILRNRFSLFVLLAVMPMLGLLLLFISEPHWLTGKFDPQCATVVSDWNAPNALTECINHHLTLDLTKAEGVTRTATYILAGKAQTLLFMMALAASLLGVFGAAYEIVKEKPVYDRERMVNLGIAPYLLSKFTVLAGFGIVQGLLLLVVIGLKVNLPADKLLLSTPVEMYVTLMLTIWASVALGLWVSALVPDGSSVIYFILLILFVQIIFASVIFELPAVTEPISDLTITRWSLESLGTSVRLNALNQLGKSVVLPDVTIKRSFEVSVPTVISETQLMPSPTGAATPVLVVTGVETKTQSLEKTVEYNDPLTSTVRMKFQLSYENMLTTAVTTSDGEVENTFVTDDEAARNTLVTRWLILLSFALGFNLLAAGTLKIRERRAH